MAIRTAYQDATAGLQKVGGQIAANVAQGQKNLKPGMPGYGAINPLKGAGKAFMRAFKKPAANGKRFSRITKQPMVTQM